MSGTSKESGSDAARVRTLHMLEEQIRATPDDKDHAEELQALRKLRDRPFKCRFYKNRFPEVEDYVMVNVENVEQLGAYVTLLEYDGIEGMVLLSELSRRRIRSVNKLIRVGKKEAVLVLRVDSKKGYVDLSKRRVIAEDKDAFDFKYNKAKHVHSILYNVAKKKQYLLRDLYEVIGWPLYEKYGHAYDGFKLALAHPKQVLGSLEGATEEVVEAVLKEITMRMKAQPVKVRADIEVTCFAPAGIDAIREALLEGKKAAEAAGDDVQVSIRLVAPPRYVLFVTHMDPKVGIDVLQKGIKKIGEVIKSKRGRMLVKIPPRVTSKQDDLDLDNMLNRIAEENAEVDGDDD